MLEICENHLHQNEQLAALSRLTHALRLKPSHPAEQEVAALTALEFRQLPSLDFIYRISRCFLCSLAVIGSPVADRQVNALATLRTTES